MKEKRMAKETEEVRKKNRRIRNSRDSTSKETKQNPIGLMTIKINKYKQTGNKQIKQHN